MAADCPAGSDETGHLDWMLRFDARTEARYEAEHGGERGAALRQIILSGLIFYNMYNFTGMILMPDISDLSVVAHLLVVTPGSALLAWLIVHLRPTLREALIFYAMIGVVAAPLLLFWLTQAPLGTYTFALREAGAPEAVRFAAALGRAVEALAIAHPGRPDGTRIVTISVGIALKEAGAARSRHALLAEADQALYRAKKRGRNGYALAEAGSAIAAIPSVSVIARTA